MTISRIRVVAGLLVLLFVASGGWVLGGILGLFWSPELYRRDFTQDYLWVRAAADGINPYQPVATLAARYLGDIPIAVFPHPTPHPPTMGLLLLPLAAFDLRTASVIWLAVELVSLAGFIAVLAARWQLPRPWLLVPAGTLALVSWAPVTQELVNGQVMVTMLLLVGLSWSSLIAGRSFLSGVFLGLSLCLKPVTLPIVLVYVFRRDARALAGGVVPPLLGLALAGLLIGWPVLGSYPSVVSDVNADYRTAVNNISGWTLGPRLFEGTGSPVVIGITAPPLVPFGPAAAAVTGLVLAAIVGFAIRTLRRVPRPEDAFGTLCCVSILLSPLAWGHYLVLALLPLAEVVRALLRRAFPRREMLLAGVVVAVVLVPGMLWITLAQLLAGQHVPPGQEAFLPFLPTAVTLAPMIAVAMLTVLAARAEIFLASESSAPNVAAANSGDERAAAPTRREP